MKRILLAGAMLAAAFTTKAQITYQTSYPGTAVSVVNLLLSGKKYCITDPLLGQVRLYNLNHTLWKSIDIPVVPGYTFYSYPAQHISENLFNIDNKVDLVLTYSGGPAGYKSVVINEIGSTIATFDSSRHIEIHNIGIDSFVLFSGVENGSTQVRTKVYKLPGTIPCSQCSSSYGLGLSKPTSTGGELSDAVPNPNSGIARIDYTLPLNVTQGEIVIFNTSGKKVGSYTVDRTFTYITVDNTMLPAGIYYYSLLADGLAPTTKKMVVIK
jgi:hypothetical protein